MSGAAWSDAEVGTLKAHYPELGTAVATLLPGRTSKMVAAKAFSLDLVHNGYRPWSACDETILRDNYRTLGAWGVAAMLPRRSISSIRDKARSLGLRRDPSAVPESGRVKAELASLREQLGLAVAKLADAEQRADRAEARLARVQAALA